MSLNLRASNRFSLGSSEMDIAAALQQEFDVAFNNMKPLSINAIAAMLDDLEK
jgi:predicted lysophospholipase L1 biosynthesis ABC-type transport system permease subunit